MRNTFCQVLFPLFLLIALQLPAQKKIEFPDVFLEARLPVSENIHLHIDKDVYLPGETVWFKAYILANGKIAGTSSNLFTELWGADGKKIAGVVSPILDGTSFGQFTLPDSMAGGEIIIRSFTRYSMVQDERNVYTKRIRILGDETEPAIQPGKTISLQVFPEGGTFISNVANTISFKATTSDGLPFTIHGLLKDSRHQLIDSIHSVHDGMGSFIIYPQENETYYLEWLDRDRQLQKTYLPPSVNTGVNLSVRQSGKSLTWSVKNPIPEGSLSEVYLIATSRQQLVYSARINSQKQPDAFGNIQTDSLPAGILTLTVFNKDFQPLAERIVFVRNKLHAFPAAIEVIERNTGKRGKNIIDLKFNDTLRQHLSLSVTDASFSFSTGHNIVTDLLLTGDIRGYVYKPEQYFTDTSGKMITWLDLVMQTNGWRKYNWDLVPGQLRSPGETIKEEYIHFSGKVTDPEDRPVPNVPVSLIMQTKDSSGQSFVVTTDQGGSFTQRDLVYFDSATLFFAVTKTKSAKQKAVIIPGNSLVFPDLAFYPGIRGETFSLKPQVRTLATGIRADYLHAKDSFEKRAKTLEEAIVKTKVKSTLEIMDDKYARLYKGTKGGRMYDIMHDPSATAARNPIEYLLTWKLPARMLYPVFQIYIDEIAVPPTQLRSLRMEQIAFVKYVPSDFLLPFTSGVYIYLKNDDDYQAENEKKLQSKLNRIKIAGYTPVKEFYNPDYSLPANLGNRSTDFRTTLYWQPDIVADHETRTIRITFYNNDFPDQVKLVLEGINEAGQLTRTEKWLD